MRDYDELIKRLRNCASDTVEDCAGCPYQGGYKGTYCMDGLISEAADAIEELASNTNKPKWIPVTERLPDMADSDWVIGVVNGKVGNVTYIDAVVMVVFDPCKMAWFLDEDPSVAVSVTHWMPLPEPPKEET